MQVWIVSSWFAFWAAENCWKLRAYFGLTMVTSLKNDDRVMTRRCMKVQRVGYVRYESDGELAGCTYASSGFTSLNWLPLGCSTYLELLEYFIHIEKLNFLFAMVRYMHVLTRKRGVYHQRTRPKSFLHRLHLLQFMQEKNK